MTQTDPALIKEENGGPEVHQVTTSLPIIKHCSKDSEKHHMKCTALNYQKYAKPWLSFVCVIFLFV